MNAAYAMAAIPEPYQVLGLRLKPLSIGHCILMMRFDCAFFSEEAKPATLADLVLAVAICSRTYEEFLKFIESRGWRNQCIAWGKRCRDFDIPAKVSIFCDYLKEGTKGPTVIFEGEPKRSGAHWTQSLKVALVNLGYTPSQAINMPLSQAFADFYKAAENEGAVRICTPDEIAAMDALDQEEANETKA